MRILLAGAGGMLGSALAALLPQVLDGVSIVPVGRASLDVTAPGAVARVIADARPDLILNAAAHTDVEGAEIDPAAAYAVNAELPALLARLCRAHAIPMIHVSSTGCYGAWKQEPYTDYDRVEPTTVHHRSKIAGEIAVRDSGAEHLIVRTGWLFGGDAAQPKNFVFKRMVEATRADIMRSDPTQRGTPTHVDALADAMASAFASGLRGTCNIVAQGAATRLDYVREIVRLSGLPCRVEAADAAFPRRARVSPNEAAINMRLQLLGLDAMDTWQAQLARYVAQLQTSAAWRDLIGDATARPGIL